MKNKVVKTFKDQQKKDLIEYEKRQKEIDKHFNTVIPLTIGNFRFLTTNDVSNRVRLEMIKAIIWSSNNMEEMWKMVCDKIANQDFGRTLD